MTAPQGLLLLLPLLLLPLLVLPRLLLRGPAASRLPGSLSRGWSCCPACSAVAPAYLRLLLPRPRRPSPPRQLPRQRRLPREWLLRLRPSCPVPFAVAVVLLVPTLLLLVLPLGRLPTAKHLLVPTLPRLLLMLLHRQGPPPLSCSFSLRPPPPRAPFPLSPLAQQVPPVPLVTCRFREPPRGGRHPPVLDATRAAVRGLLGVGEPPPPLATSRPCWAHPPPA